MRHRRTSQTGFTLLEMLIALAIAATLLLSLSGTVSRVLEIRDDSRTRSAATREARFAMQRMVNAVRQSDRLLLPLADNPDTNWREDIREQSSPPKPPEGDSTLATAVLAVTLGRILDRDEDGWADANNDKDYLDLNDNSIRDPGEPERIDEDLDNDNHNDFAPGIRDIDDNGDGQVDSTGQTGDDDEDGFTNEDNIGNGDEDTDGAADEDLSDDINGDNQPGVAGFDDDYDGDIDEGTNDDDDEDGLRDEDWFDPVVFFLSGTTLMERLPDINPANGADYSEYAIAENVTYFRVERVAGASALMAHLTVEITLPDSEPTRLSTRVRVGGGR